ncbi:MAG: hypothetical protein DI603_14525 [Roseateles depolymerans]|uniref:EF-hand domain-containing protein n=1 Tax=Roseateles depolymerans TaxID=76731 RepID=A0A2W5FIB6_9BURK|nr:MAG: hypothetical protein DI603_14525 [Roseateles depolymerans]
MISALNSTAAPSVNVSAKSAGRPDSEQLFKQLDTGSKGYLTADDLQAVVVKISAEGAKRADAAGSAPSAEDLAKQLDTDGDNQVSLAEFKAAEPKQGAQGGAAPAQGAQAGGGARAAGGAPAAGGTGGGGASSVSSSGSSSSTSSTSSTYEPADTNEDGKVSTEEQQAYDAKIAEQRAEASGQARTKEADTAISTYESVASA